MIRYVFRRFSLCCNFSRIQNDIPRLYMIIAIGISNQTPCQGTKCIDAGKYHIIQHSTIHKLDKKALAPNFAVSTVVSFI